MGMFSDCFEQIMDRVESAVDEEIQEAVVPEAKRRCPRKTGRLQESIEGKTERDGAVITGVIETDVPYGPFQEFGSHGHPGKAFMRGGAAVFDLERVADRVKGGDL